MTISLGMGTSAEFFAKEFSSLNVKDKRLNRRAEKIFVELQSKLSSCVRRIFTDANDARQAYDFFFQPQNNKRKID